MLEARQIPLGQGQSLHSGFLHLPRRSHTSTSGPAKVGSGLATRCLYHEQRNLFIILSFHVMAAAVGVFWGHGLASWI